MLRHETDSYTMPDKEPRRTIDADSAFWLRAGKLASAAWLYICTIALVLLIPPGLVKKESLGLNELGDALAGFFVPLGLIWVVVGVMLQHLQTKQNTDAIEMQGEELKLAVKEFAEMAREQKRTNDIAIENQLEARRQVKPDLAYYAYGEPSDNKPYLIRLINRGAACTVDIYAGNLRATPIHPDKRDGASDILYNGSAETFSIDLSSNAINNAKTRGVPLWAKVMYAEPEALKGEGFKQSFQEVLLLRIGNDGVATIEKSG